MSQLRGTPLGALLGLSRLAAGVDGQARFEMTRQRASHAVSLSPVLAALWSRFADWQASGNKAANSYRGGSLNGVAVARAWSTILGAQRASEAEDCPAIPGRRLDPRAREAVRVEIARVNREHRPDTNQRATRAGRLTLLPAGPGPGQCPGSGTTASGRAMLPR